MKEIELGEILKQYRVTEIIDDSTEYKQITISQTGVIKIRGFKKGSSIGRKRQFIIDLKNYPNTLLFVRQGVQKGGIGIAGADLHGSIATENMPMFEISDQVNPTYLDFYLKSSVFKNKVNSIEATGTAQKSIHERVLLKIKINLPSRKEQDSLVKKLSETKRKFKALNEEYLSQEENLTKLRQSILQDAVQGKLTKEWRAQNPKIEPASELLKKIKVEKEQLIKEKKIKKEKPLPPITKDEIPFEIPESWEWCKMQDLCPNISSGSTPPKNEFKNEGVPYLKVYNIRNQRIDFNYKSQFVNKEYHSTKLKRSILHPGDIIMNIVGPPLGKTAIIPSDFKEWNCNQAIVFFKPLKSEINQWIYTYLLSEDYLKRIVLIGTAGQDNISVTKSKNIETPLPPLEEQKAIVEKVSQLLSNCDFLEKEIQASKTNAEKLMQSVLSELLGEES